MRVANRIDERALSWFYRHRSPGDYVTRENVSFASTSSLDDERTRGTGYRVIRNSSREHRIDIGILE